MATWAARIKETGLGSAASLELAAGSFVICRLEGLAWQVLDTPVPLDTFLDHAAGPEVAGSGKEPFTA